MRVYDRELTGATGETGRPADAQKAERSGGASPAPSGSGPGDRVELSSGLATVSRALAAEGSSRGEKIQQLAAQVQAGTYEPDSQAISQGMVKEALSVSAGGQ